ncbi:hypothetical protein NRB36_004308 [Salmonella enterica]|nr:hypothetical protein [Salmonella enterica]EJO1639667.1 hypothetical protein [Salmonella enterica]
MTLITAGVIAFVAAIPVYIRHRNQKRRNAPNVYPVAMDNAEPVLILVNRTNPDQVAVIAGSRNFSTMLHTFETDRYGSTECTRIFYEGDGSGPILELVSLKRDIATSGRVYATLRDRAGDVIWTSGGSVKPAAEGKRK